MKALAIRDDGARLIGDDDLECGLLESEDGSVVLPVASILARGYWGPGAPGTVKLRPETEAAIRQASAEFTQHQLTD